MIDCFRNAGNIIRANTPITEQTHSTRFRAGVVRSNLQIISAVESYAATHTDIVNPAVDLTAWEMEKIAPAKEGAKKTLTSINALEIAASNVIFHNFSRLYHCVKTLAADGVPDAIAIWPVMRQVWDHLRGKRGPQCEVKEVNNVLMMANKVFEKHGERYFEILNNEKLLAENLAHHIHKEDEISDHALDYIHHASQEKH